MWEGMEQREIQLADCSGQHSEIRGQKKGFSCGSGFSVLSLSKGSRDLSLRRISTIERFPFTNERIHELTNDY
jgi:hypothetical protein